MTFENTVVNALMEEIENQLIGYGINANDLMVSRGSQPTDQFSGAQGNARANQIFITPITNSSVNLTRQSVIEGNELKAHYDHNKLITLQVDCLTNFSTSEPSTMTAVNLLQLTRELLGHRDAQLSLKSKGVNIVIRQPVRPSYTVLDQGMYESAPSFYIQFNFNSSHVKAAPGTKTVVGIINEV